MKEIIIEIIPLLVFLPMLIVGVLAIYFGCETYEDYLKRYEKPRKRRK